MSNSHTPTGEVIGKPKGTTPQHKSVKQAYLDVFQRLGGVEGMLQWALSTPDNLTEFYRMYSRMLPRNVDLSSDAPIQIVVARYGELAPPSPVLHRVTATNSNERLLTDKTNEYDEYEKLAHDIDTPNTNEKHSQLAQPVAITRYYDKQ